MSETKSADHMTKGFHRFETVTDILLPPEEVFPFFAAAENLERITPPELRFQILTPLPIEMRQGTLIEYRLRLQGIPFLWRTEISEWNPPHAFTDRQLKGPYHSWIHRHTFEATADGTRMTDRVDYRLPFWPPGELALPFVRRKIHRIFEFRGEVIRQVLDRSGGSSTR
jgi:ligand-binding SRPBCC domain-containing protein